MKKKKILEELNELSKTVRETEYMLNVVQEGTALSECVKNKAKIQLMRDMINTIYAFTPQKLSKIHAHILFLIEEIEKN